VDLPAPSRGERFHSYSGGSGTVSSLGNNLGGETDGSSEWIASDLTGTAASPLAPLLGPLGNYGSKPPGRSAPFHGRISLNRIGTVASTCVGRRTDCALPHRSCTVRTLGRRILGPLVSSGRSSRRTITVVPSRSNPRGALHRSR
jgi:hypothetical protein